MSNKSHKSFARAALISLILAVAASACGANSGPESASAPVSATTSVTIPASDFSYLLEQTSSGGDGAYSGPSTLQGYFPKCGDAKSAVIIGTPTDLVPFKAEAYEGDVQKAPLYPVNVDFESPRAEYRLWKAKVTILSILDVGSDAKFATIGKTIDVLVRTSGGPVDMARVKKAVIALGTSAWILTQYEEGIRTVPEDYGVIVAGKGGLVMPLLQGGFQALDDKLPKTLDELKNFISSAIC